MGGSIESTDNKKSPEEKEEIDWSNFDIDQIPEELAQQILELDN